jgi:hypothetical protein
MPRRRRHSKRNVREIEFVELLELLCGPGEGGSLFATNDERREVYYQHRNRVLDAVPDHWTGPAWAWSEYEAPRRRTPTTRRST